MASDQPDDWFASNPPPAPAGSTAAPTIAGGDANAWMGLVGNQDQLSAWVKGQLPAGSDPSLVNYYVGKIQGQPGANPTEQAGGVDYWSNKIKSGGADTAGSGYNANQYGVPSTPYQSVTYGGNFNTPAPTGALANQYQPLQWTGGDFAAPAWATNELSTLFQQPTDVTEQNDPGVGFRLRQVQQGVERSAAGKGTILNGGTQSAIAQRVGDQASAEFGDVFNRALQTKQQNVGQAQTGFTDAFNQYQQKYGMFNDARNADLNARQQNQGEYQANVLGPAQAQNANQYAAFLNQNSNSLQDYLTNYNINRTGIQDFLGQNNTVANRGLTAVTAGRPS